MEITGRTKLVGILGDPVSHSLSPKMQNTAFEAMGLAMAYVPLLVKAAELKAAVQGIKAMNFRGANVTIPHKTSIAGLMDRLDESAAITGAVNTVVNEEGVLIGYNTDGNGFITALEEVITPGYPDMEVMLLGAGGAARSVGVALAQKGVKAITIVNRNRDRAEELQRILQRYFPTLSTTVFTFDDDFSLPLAESRLVINATPVGMEGNLKAPLLPVDRLTKVHVVCDLVYVKSGKTSLEIVAQEKGATTLGGEGMLLHQGAEAIYLWTGKQPPLDIMRRAIESR